MIYICMVPLLYISTKEGILRHSIPNDSGVRLKSYSEALSKVNIRNCVSQTEENEGYIKGSLLFNKSSNYFFLCYVNATIENQMPHHLKCPFKKCAFCFVFSNIFWKVNAQ